MNSLVNSIYKVLDQLGLTAQKRALHIQFSNPDSVSYTHLDVYKRQAKTYGKGLTRTTTF